ncbi:MAG: glycosyltransferase family 4 protein [Calothrix sp. SM1_7_51]|nr:glycosyltransferase family 4 protein [Calothrix sp. SM1_7_51]
MKVNHKVIFPIINGEISGGNIVCLHLIDEALSRGWEVIVNSPTDGTFCEMLRQRGVGIYHLNTNRSFRWDTAWKMAEIIKRKQIDLVHVHAPFAGSTLACLAGKIANVPVIVHAHSQDPLSKNLVIKVYQKIMRWWTSKVCCNAVISVSQQVKQEMIAQGFDARKSHVIYNGTPLKHYEIEPNSIRHNLNIPDDVFVVIHIGRLCQGKGQHILLQAASILRQSDKKIIYLIIGEDLEKNGAYLQHLKDMAAELKVNDIVKFLGQRLDVPQILAAADLLVLPSLSEGLPLVILEAMAVGKPVVATSVGGIAEIVIHQETGLLIPVEDALALAEAILWMVKNPFDARIMGNKALEMVKVSFSVEKMQQEVFDIYENVLRT